MRLSLLLVLIIMGVNAMKVYYNGKHKKMRIYVQPGADYPEVSAWMENGKPKMFTIQFKNGVFETDSQLGKYLVDKGLASKNKVVEIIDDVA